MLPRDPMILLSVLNTKLRDEYPSLEELCRDLDLDQRTLEDKMAAAGFSYDEARNAFR